MSLLFKESDVCGESMSTVIKCPYYNFKESIVCGESMFTVIVSLLFKESSVCGMSTVLTIQGI